MKVSLKELRARANISQAQAAFLIGINPAVYNAWENLSMADIQKVASVYGVDPKDIQVPRAQ